MNHKNYIIAAVDSSGGLAQNKSIPWHFKNDLRFFKQVTSEVQDPTKRNVVFMGRKTWESLPDTYRPLPGRENVVLTRQGGYVVEGARIVSSFDEYFTTQEEDIEKTFIIGGAEVYASAFENMDIAGVYVTRIHQDFQCDQFFPQIPGAFSKEILIKTLVEDGVTLEFFFYAK